jgi:hypothetical protein
VLAVGVMAASAGLLRAAPPGAQAVEGDGSVLGAFPDYGDAPDESPACGIAGGVGHFPTFAGTINAAPGRDGPKHVLAPEVTLGGAITGELAANQPFCDWFTPGCDDPGPPISDDGALVLCLTPACTSGVTISAGVCGIGFGGAFGPSPGPLPLGWWIIDTVRSPFSTVPAFVNIVSDHDLTGVYDDSPVGWCIKDAPVPPNPTPFPLLSLYASTPFPVFTISKLPLGRWSIGPFWNRFIVGPEMMTASFIGTYDGSGTVPAYPFGETEDWLPLTDPGDEWSCGLPRYCFESNGLLVISLNPADTTCAQGVPVPLDSLGMNLGDVREFRVGPYRNDTTIATEILSLNLQGFAPQFGPVIVSERADKMSLGALTRIQAPPGLPPTMDSFFDVFLKVELPSLGMTFRNDLAVRLSPRHPINGLDQPTVYQKVQGTDAVPLVDQNNRVRGWMCYAEWNPFAFIDWACPGDANGDRVVDFADITAELSNWNQGGPAGDADTSCHVNFADVTATLSNFGAACPR